MLYLYIGCTKGNPHIPGSLSVTLGYHLKTLSIMEAITFTATEVKVFLKAASLALEIVDCDDPNIMEANRQARVILDKIQNFSNEHIGNKTFDLIAR